ncbi:MAG: hypothetical protein GF388_06760 [Candidatus Aegiribacteria sp.]|nr:hypothetical protein [Candidatus Aegiribacteria sp.]MBD3294846.1 hypothetical protein [Candidatus Fermentibacteria bacterium]
MNMDGQVLDWHQYEFYRLCDLEVVDGEVHVVDAFAPRSFVVDLQTWELETIIDDLSLYYFYDLAFDGVYLYVTEWDMNRYLPDGTKDSSAGFDYDSYGSCFAEGFLWTLSEDGLIHCWTVQEWPDLEEVTSAAFSPPADSCRGLWHDGDYFWTAQAFESSAGNIYRFDSEGTVIDQWQAPAFTGWSACVYEGYPSSLSPATWGEIKTSMH